MFVYPNPALVIVIEVISPDTTFPVAVAVDPIPTPIRGGAVNLTGTVAVEYPIPGLTIVTAVT